MKPSLPKEKCSELLGRNSRCLPYSACQARHRCSLGNWGGESQLESIGGLGKECVGMGKVWKGEGARLWVNGRVQESKSIRV